MRDKANDAAGSPLAGPTEYSEYFGPQNTAMCRQPDLDKILLGTRTTVATRRDGRRDTACYLPLVPAYYFDIS